MIVMEGQIGPICPTATKSWDTSTVHHAHQVRAYCWFTQCNTFISPELLKMKNYELVQTLHLTPGFIMYNTPLEQIYPVNPRYCKYSWHISVHIHKYVTKSVTALESVRNLIN